VASSSEELESSPVSRVLSVSSSLFCFGDDVEEGIFPRMALRSLLVDFPFGYNDW
jgi:hypothetical protein